MKTGDVVKIRTRDETPIGLVYFIDRDVVVSEVDDERVHGYVITVRRYHPLTPAAFKELPLDLGLTSWPIENLVTL